MNHRLVCLVLAMLSGTVVLEPATAQDTPLTEREKMLLQRIEQLEERLSEVEEKLEAAQAPREAPKPSARSESETPAPAEPSPNDFRAYWKEGIRFDTSDGRFKLRINGRLQTDAAFFDQDDELELLVGDEDDGAEIRRAYLTFSGDIYENVLYKVSFDLAAGDGNIAFTDTYVGMDNIPHVGRVLVGHFKEPFGLEQLTSNKYLTFMERSVADAFTPARNFGIQADRTFLNDRLYFALGAYKNTDAVPGFDDKDEDQGWAITTRVAGTPWYEDDGRRMLHLAAAYSHRNPDGAVLGYSTRPEAHLANRYVNTERFEGFRFLDARMDDVDLYGTEAALIFGPLHLQGEYMHADVDTDFAGDVDLSGYYAQASYFLTGEHRPYSQSSATMGRLHPKNNFGWGEGAGWGAWEIALRYSSIDLSDGLIRGGEEDNWTLGLNWYLNPNAKIMLNYGLADIDHDLYDGDLETFQARFQVTF